MAALVCASAVLGASAAEPSTPVSQAERLLFVEPHLQGVQAPSTLRYRFESHGSVEPQRADTLQLQLRPEPDGRCCAAAVVAGTRPALPPVEHAVANPVVLHFLERELREMQRRTGGHPNHFRRRIRLALADAATVSPTEVTHRGRRWPAFEVRIAPYADDPMRLRYARWAATQYVFVVAAGVPGGVAQLRMQLPGAAAGDAPLHEETLTLEDA